MAVKQFHVPQGVTLTGKDIEGNLVINQSLKNYFATASQEISDSELSQIASILADRSETYFRKLDAGVVHSSELVLDASQVVDLKFSAKGQVEEILKNSK